MNNRLTFIDIAGVVELEGALCAKIGDPADWFPDSGRPDIAQAAKAVCKQCPVAVRCLQLAMDFEGQSRGSTGRYGIYGGLSANERSKLAEGTTERGRRTAASREGAA